MQIWSVDIFLHSGVWILICIQWTFQFKWVLICYINICKILMLMLIPPACRIDVILHVLTFSNNQHIIQWHFLYCGKLFFLSNLNFFPKFYGLKVVYLLFPVPLLQILLWPQGLYFIIRIVAARSKKCNSFVFVSASWCFATVFNFGRK